jgi:3-deoxy-D-manno-octulosonic-acid transferase
MLALPLLSFSKRLGKGGEERTFKKKVKPADLWIQAASVGEANLAATIIKSLNPPLPIKVLLSSGTDQGIEILKQAIDKIPDRKIITADVAYFPFDSPTIMDRAVSSIRPKVMILLETELWPGLLFTLKKYICKTLVINGRINPKNMIYYTTLPSIWRMLKPDQVLAISEDDANRFKVVFGRDHVDVMQNIKFDNLGSANFPSISDNPLNSILKPSEKFLVLGSVRREEEADVSKIIKTILVTHPKTVIGLFPRHMNRIHYWEKTLARLKKPWVLRSETTKPVPPGSVIIWDTIGELNYAYNLATAVFVGGSLKPLGGQNFLEPLTAGVVPVIGPSWENFKWVGDEIVEKSLVRIAKDWKDVAKMLNESLTNPDSRKKIIETASKYVKERQGGTNRARDLILEYIKQGKN